MSVGSYDVSKHRTDEGALSNLQGMHAEIGKNSVGVAMEVMSFQDKGKRHRSKEANIKVHKRSISLYRALCIAKMGLNLTGH